MLKTIDLNCDIGESFGVYSFQTEEEIMKYITSANIACGFHAGDFSTMNRTVLLAKQSGVKIGAHPGLPDLQGFGRRTMAISPQEAYEMVLYQIGALAAFTRVHGLFLHHVKPHGALYNMAATRAELAKAIAQAVYDFNSELILYGLAGSELIRAGKNCGLQTANEVFADRTYQLDGTLTPRTEQNALITNVDEAIQQAMRMITAQRVRTTSDTDLEIQADTICVHGDGPFALDFVLGLREAITEAGFSL